MSQYQAPEEGKTFMQALFDFSFRNFITRKVASVFFILGLIGIAIGALAALVFGVWSGIAAMGQTPGSAIWTIIGTVIGVPVFTFVWIILLRLMVEASIALIAVAENTERTAENTKRG